MGKDAAYGFGGIEFGLIFVAIMLRVILFQSV